MQVHERYLGRTLRCTSCRAEFLAMLPADAVVEDPAPIEIEPSGARKSWTRHLRWLVVLVPMALAVWWLGQDHTGLLATHRSMGEIGVLDNTSGGPVVVALDSDSAEILLKAGDDAGTEELTSLIKRGRAFEMDSGTTVRVLSSVGGGRVVQVRVITGPWESRKVWVPTRWIR